MATIQKRAGKTGTSYKVQIRIKGHPPETATFDRLTDARKWATQTEAAIRAGKHFGIAKRRTFAELADKYVDAISSGAGVLKSAEGRKSHLEYWRDAFEGFALSDVTPAAITEERNKLGKGQTKQGIRSPSTVNRYIATLSAAFTFAVKELQWIDANPVERVKKNQEAPGRVRYLTDDERVRLLAACKASRNPLLYPAVILALSTGARQSEIMLLRWPQIDLTRRAIRLYDGTTKNGKGRVLPLSGEAFDLMKERAKVRDLRDDRVFPVAARRAFGSLRGAWEGAVKRAGVEDFHWHDFRHTAASYLTMAGVGAMEVAKVLGHKTLEMTARYSHLSPERTVELGDVLAARLGLNKNTAA